MAINFSANDISLLFGTTSLWNSTSTYTPTFFSFDSSFVLPKAELTPYPVVQAKAQFKTPDTVTPWNEATSQRLASAYELLNQPFATATKITANTTAHKDLQQIFTAYETIKTMKVLAEFNATSLSTSQKAEASRRMDELLGNLQNYMAEPAGSPAILAFGNVSVSASSQGSRIPPSSFTTAALTQTRDGTLDFAANSSITLRLTNSVGTHDVRVDLAPQMTLDEVANSINTAIQNAPGMHSTRVSLERITDGWALKFTALSDNLVLIDEGATLATGVIAGGATSNLNSVFQTGGTATHSAINEIKDSSGKAIDIKISAAAQDQYGNMVVAGAVKNGSQTQEVVMKISPSGQQIWQTAMPEGSKVSGIQSTDRGLFITSLNGTNPEFHNIDDSGRIVQAKMPEMASGWSVSTATADPFNEGWTIVAMRSNAGEAKLARVDNTGEVVTETMLDGRNAMIGQISPTANGFMITSFADGQTKISQVSSGNLAIGAEVQLGEGRPLKVIQNSDTGEIAVLRRDHSGAQHLDLIKYDAAGVVTNQITTALDASVSDIAFSEEGITAVGFANNRNFVRTLDKSSLAETNNYEWIEMSSNPTPPLAVSWKTGNSALKTLGLSAGEVADSGASRKIINNLPGSPKVGDSFFVESSSGRHEIVLQADDTLTTLARRITTALGGQGTATQSVENGMTVLRITADTEEGISITSGRDGKDLLSALGLEPQFMARPKIPGDKDPVVSPGGLFSLKLNGITDIRTAEKAEAAIQILDEAINVLQVAYRSLYWDSTKAERVVADFTNGSNLNSYQSNRLANMQEALARLGG